MKLKRYSSFSLFSPTAEEQIFVSRISKLNSIHVACTSMRYGSFLLWAPRSKLITSSPLLSSKPMNLRFEQFFKGTACIYHMSVPIMSEISPNIVLFSSLRSNLNSFIQLWKEHCAIVWHTVRFWRLFHSVACSSLIHSFICFFLPLSFRFIFFSF